MNRDLESLLRDDAEAWRRPARPDLPRRVRASIAAKPRAQRRRWTLPAGIATLAAAALILVVVTLQSGRPAAPAGPTSGASMPAPLDLPVPVQTQPLRQSEDLLLREVVLLQQDAENAIDFVMSRIPERVRPLVMIDRML